MRIRQSIRYHARWVRLLCCLALGIGIGNAVFFGALSGPETAVRDYVVYSETTLFRYASQPVEIAILLAICLLMAWIRFERPMLMVLGGAGMIVGYVFVYMTVLLTRDYVLPAVAPLLSIVVCSGMLETMAWSEERYRRRTLEGIDSARQQFIDMLVHDLRRRVSAVLTSVSLLEKSDHVTANGSTDVLNTMRASADRIMLLVNNLLDIRKVEEGAMALEREQLPLRPLLQAALADTRDGAEMAGLTLTLNCDDRLTVHVDSGIFGRMMGNLLWNAVQHGVKESVVEVHGSADDGLVRISVGNRGPTIAADEQERIFRAFVSGHGDPHNVASDSTGLGLSFCRLAVEAHGGTISLESPWPPHSDGVCVTMTLPSE